jgi:hypothetical protein
MGFKYIVPFNSKWIMKILMVDNDPDNRYLPSLHSMN